MMKLILRTAISKQYKNLCWSASRCIQRLHGSTSTNTSLSSLNGLKSKVSVNPFLKSPVKSPIISKSKSLKQLSILQTTVQKCNLSTNYKYNLRSSRPLHAHCTSIASVCHYNSVYNNTSKRCFSNNNNGNNNSSEKERDVMEGLHSSNRMREREKIGDIIEGNVPNLQTVKHPQIAEEIERSHDIYEINDDFNEHYTMPHPIWSESQANNIEITHTAPTRLPDYLAYFTVQSLRLTWDITTGYIFGRKLGLFNFSHNLWLLRIVYLETVAGVPGMMFGMVRHLNSLRRMERDHGWIHTLLAEAENERMHLLTFMKLYQPSKPFRYCVVGAQFIMSNFLFLAYLASPRFCHKFVGYLEEEAVKTYTGLLEDIDAGKLPEFNERASRIARGYWQLPKNATWRDVFLQVRADEAHHREVNHTLAPLSTKKGSSNPFRNEV